MNTAGQFIQLTRVLPDGTLTPCWLRWDRVFGIHPILATVHKPVPWRAGEHTAEAVKVTVVFASLGAMNFESWVQETPDVILSSISNARKEWLHEAASISGGVLHVGVVSSHDILGEGGSGSGR